MILDDISNESYIVEPSTFWIFNISFVVAFILNLQLISAVLIRTLLFIPACRLDTNTSTSVFNYVLVLSALVFKELAEAISKSFISCFVYTFEAEAFRSIQLNMSILLNFNIEVLSTYLNVSS